MKKTRPRADTLWITDSWDTLDFPRETTLRLIEEGLQLGMRQFWSSANTLSLEKHASIEAREVLSIAPARSSSDDFSMAQAKRVELGMFRWVHYRCDPPVDQRFLHDIQILKWAQRDEWSRKKPVEIINSPEVTLLINEKFAGMKWSPPSLVSAHWETLRAFGLLHGTTVLKPLSLAQSKGVEKISWKDPRSNQELLARATQEFKIPILLQGFSKAIADGEDRIWYVDGTVLGHVRKWPLTGDFRVQIDLGSRIEAAPLSKAQQKLALEVGKTLRAHGVRLAAVDLIGTQVIDFNVTSPGLLVQMERVLGKNLSKPLIQRLCKIAR